MRTAQVNRLSNIGLIVLSFIALLTVLNAFLPGHTPYVLPDGRPDEGTSAHIFQLAIVSLVPMGMVFFATADWTQPWRNVRRLAVPALATVLAFVALYYLEHVYYPAR